MVELSMLGSARSLSWRGAQLPWEEGTAGVWAWPSGATPTDIAKMVSSNFCALMVGTVVMAESRQNRDRLALVLRTAESRQISFSPQDRNQDRMSLGSQDRSQDIGQESGQDEPRSSGQEHRTGVRTG